MAKFKPPGVGRQLVVLTATYWFRQSTVVEHTMAERLLYLENALNPRTR